MKRKRTIILSLALALILTLGSFAIPALAAWEGEVIDVTLFMVSGRIESPDSEITRDYLRDNLGINLIANLTNESWQQKYAQLIYSGDIPTLSNLPVADFYSYAAEGAYLPLTNLVGNYPGIMNYVPENIWPRLTVEGEIYGLPNMNVAGKYNIIYREDWMKNLNMDVPKTMDEFTELMRAFTEDDPDGNGVNDTYGYGNYNLNMFYGMFGGVPGFYHLNDAGQIEIGSISEGYKGALEYYKMLYDKGYVDPEALTQQGEQFWQKVSQGKVGSWVGWWSEYHAPWQSYDFANTQPDGHLITTYPVTGPDGKSGMVAADPLSSVVGISYLAEENIDHILTFIEWAMSDHGYRTMKYGVIDIFFEMDGDELVWIYSSEPGRVNRNGNESGDMEVYSIFSRMDIYTELLQGDTWVQQASVIGFNQAVSNPLIENAFLGIITEEFQTLMPDITRYVDEMRIRFILGDESFDAWDAYVAEFVRLGGVKVAESLLPIYNEMYGKSATLAIEN